MAKSDVHGPTPEAGRAYCGRKATTTHDWSFVTCIDCLAAMRADHAAGLPRRTRDTPI